MAQIVVSATSPGVTVASGTMAGWNPGTLAHPGHAWLRLVGLQALIEDAGATIDSATATIEWSNGSQISTLEITELRFGINPNNTALPTGWSESDAALISTFASDQQVTLDGSDAETIAITNALNEALSWIDSGDVLLVRLSPTSGSANATPVTFSNATVTINYTPGGGPDQQVDIATGRIGLRGADVSVNQVARRTIAAGRIGLRGATVSADQVIRRTIAAGRIGLRGATVSAVTSQIVTITAGRIGLRGATVSARVGLRVTISAGRIALRGSRIRYRPGWKYVTHGIGVLIPGGTGPSSVE